MGTTRRLSGMLLAALGLLLMIPAYGSAAGFHLEIDNALLDLGSISAVRAIDSTGETPDPPATLTGTLTNGQVQIPRSNFEFPAKTTEVTNGLMATVDLTANREITGQFNASTGEMTLAFSLKATVLALGQTCVINPIKASLSTGYGKPYLGVPFAGGTAGQGALSGHWNDLPAPTGGTVCQIVGQLTTGPGGIWMAHGLSDAETCADDPGHPGCDTSNPCANGPSSECCARSPQFAPCRDEAKPKLSLSVSPKLRKVKAGGVAIFNARVKNSGAARASGVRICPGSPRRKAPAGKCVTAALGPGKSLTRKFKFKLKKNVRGRFKVTFKLTGPGLATKSVRATIQVRA